MSQQKTVTYKKLLHFFLPLAATPFLIASSHSIMNAAIARLPSPDFSLAAFTVVKAFANVVKAPGLLAKEINISLVNDTKSLRLVDRFLVFLVLLYMIIMLIFAYSPLGISVLQNFFNLDGPQVLSFATTALRIVCFLPLVEIFRNRYQGLAIGVRHTSLVSFGTFVRLIVLCFFLLIVVKFQVSTGVIVASLAWILGIAIEGLLLAGVFHRSIGTPVKAANKMPTESQKSLNIHTILVFFIPLALMVSLQAFFLPYMQSAIAKGSIDPTQTLAAFGVAWALFTLIVNPLKGLTQCSLVFTRDNDSRQVTKVMRFCLLMGLIISAILLVISVTPIGYWIFRYIIGVSEDIAQIAKATLLTTAAYPLLRSFGEFYWGLLMRTRHTTAIAVGKVVNMLTLMIILGILIGPLKSLISFSPAMLAGIGFSCGQLVENVFLWRYASTTTTVKQNLTPAAK